MNAQEFTWEQKVKLVTLANKAKDKISREELLNYVIENMNSFDQQAWDMYFNGIELIKENIIENFNQHKQIYEKTKALTTGDLKTSIRMALYEMLVEDNPTLNQ